MKIADTVFIFIGPPGAGKGSLAQLCEHEFGVMSLSTGNICRQYIAQQTELGKQIDALIKAGNLLPDELIISMVETWLDEHLSDTASIIFDGFPRTVEQAHALQALLTRRFPTLDVKVVFFMIDDATVIDRIVSRLTCTNKNCQMVYSTMSAELKPRDETMCDRCGAPLMRRSDDQVAAIQHRLQAYHAYKDKLLAWYREQQVPIISLDVTQSLHPVYASFKEQVGLAHQ